MLIRTITLAAASAGLFSAGANAQIGSQEPLGVRPVELSEPIIHAGRYHVATGTMHYTPEALRVMQSRSGALGRAPQAPQGANQVAPPTLALGVGSPEIIYENTALTGFVFPWRVLMPPSGDRFRRSTSVVFS